MRYTRKVTSIVVVLSISLLSEPGKASWLSDITGINIDVPAGSISFDRPHPEHIGEMLQHLPQDVGQAVFNPVGATMATLIRQAYGQARPGSQPIPSDIRGVLAPFFPPFILDKARWTAFDANRFDFASDIMKLNCNVGAVTVDNVIVFRKRTDGLSNWSLWAHELIHVTQYHNMGVEGFANVYTLTAGNDLEGPAYSWQDHVEQVIQAGEAPERVWNASPEAAGGNSFSNEQFLDAARSTYPANVCARWSTVQLGATLSNVCSVPIRVVGWEQEDPSTGERFTIQCIANCGLSAGATNGFVSPRVGLWTDVFFDFPGFPNVDGHLPTQWTGNNTLPLTPEPPVNDLLPSGFALSPCGCWGPVAPGAAAPNAACSSGVEVAWACQGMCPGGGLPWQRLCR